MVLVSSLDENEKWRMNHSNTEREHGIDEGAEKVVKKEEAEEGEVVLIFETALASPVCLECVKFLEEEGTRLGS